VKHTLPVTAILIGVFVISQLVGLGLITMGINIQTDENGKPVIQHEDTALGPRPETTGLQSFLYLVIGVAIGTGVLLFMIYFRLSGVMKLWLLIAIAMATTISLGSILPFYLALAIAITLAVWRTWKPNVWVHNISEVFVYSGIALLLVPIFDVFYAVLLLIVIAIYDAYAVWRSEHMIKMAKFQTESKVFAGLLVPYKAEKEAVKKAATDVKSQLKTKVVVKPSEPTNAILGGGDVAFPMLFAGVVMDWLLKNGATKIAAYMQSLIVVFFATIALLLLFMYAKQDRFYPAMPFITAGCFIGFGVVWLLQLL
jgi:presenilin-like A22 family membrane protease